MLCDSAGQFLALDRRWPIARMADSVVDRPVKTHDFAAPLKVMAFISALGIAGRPEWEALRDAVKAGRSAGLAIRLSVYAGEEALLEAIRADLQVLADIEVNPLPEGTSDIETAVQNFSPHILHFFCHGSTAHGVYELELATLLDRLKQSQSGSVRLRVDQIVNIPAIANVWLVTLNCCEGGRSTGDFHSMAHSLVACGIPAVIGSLDPIDAGDAHEFCAKLYPTIFDMVRRRLDSAQTDEVEIEWAQVLRPPRLGLCERYNDDRSNARQWALPVLYVRPEPFTLKKLIPGVDPEALASRKARAEIVAGALRALPPDTPEQVRTNLLAMLAGFPPSLVPDRFGNFISVSA